MTNVEGVHDDQKKLNIAEIKPLDLEILIRVEKLVQGGMMPTSENCVDAVQNGMRGGANWSRRKKSHTRDFT